MPSWIVDVDSASEEEREEQLGREEARRRRCLIQEGSRREDVGGLGAESMVTKASSLPALTLALPVLVSTRAAEAAYSHWAASLASLWDGVDAQWSSDGLSLPSGLSLPWGSALVSSSFHKRAGSGRRRVAVDHARRTRSTPAEAAAAPEPPASGEVTAHSSGALARWEELGSSLAAE